MIDRLRGRTRAWPWPPVFAWVGFPLVAAGALAGSAIRARWGMSGYEAETLLGVAVLAVLCIAPIVRDALARRLDVFELGTGFRLLYFMYFGARTLWILVGTPVHAPTWAAWPPQVLDATTTHPSVILAGLPQAVWCADLGMAAYQFGYSVPIGGERLRKLVLPKTVPLDPRLFVGAAAALYVLGFLSRVPGLTHGWFMSFAANRYHVPAVVETVSFFSVLGILGFTLAFATLNAPGGSKTLPLLALAVMVPFEAAYALLFGSKFYLMLLVCIPFITYHYLRRRISFASVLALVVVFIFVVGPVVSAYRTVAQQESFTLRGLGALPHLARDVAHQLTSRPPADFVKASVAATLGRFAGIEGVAAVTRGVTVVMGYAHGATLAWMLKILVPTAVWPEKYDALIRTLEPVPHLYGFPDFAMGGIGLTQVAELYWNFGAPAVLAGMCLIGVFHRLLVVWLIRPPSLLSVFIYSAVWPSVMLSIETWFYAVYPNIFRFLVIMLIVVGSLLWITRRRAAAVAVEQPMMPA
jgi:hypothetical protein